MSFRDPDWLPTPAPFTGPDALFANPCMECDGSGEVDCGRDWQVMRCEACDGTGEEPESVEDFDYLVDGDL